MSPSSPDDLAVAFLSLARRLNEAAEDAPPEAIARAQAAVQQSIARASTALGCPPDAAAVAAAIQSRAVNSWNDAELTAIQQAATDAGTAIRDLQAAAP